MFESVKQFFQPQRNNMTVVGVSGPVDYESIPLGFFNVETASGKKSLGYRGNFLSWSVGKTVIDGVERITLAVPRSELPTVRLNYQRSQKGAMQVGAHRIIDTDTLDGDNTVAWDGATPSSGVQWV